MSTATAEKPAVVDDLMEGIASDYGPPVFKIAEGKRPVARKTITETIQLTNGFAEQLKADVAAVIGTPTGERIVETVSNHSWLSRPMPTGVANCQRLYT